MPLSLDDKLVIAITSRALFDLDQEDRVYREQGLAAYRAYQLEREDVPLQPGTGFPLVRALLRINQLLNKHLVEVVLISRNDADSGLRILNSIEHHNLGMSRAAFTDGRPTDRYLEAFWCKLFLSADEADVRSALSKGFPAARVYPPPESLEDDADEVRIAFDGDAVLFSGESERVFQERGLDAFQQLERELENKPLNPGPFKSFLQEVAKIQQMFPDGDCPIRTALVTARNAPAHRRPIKTLRSWGIRVDESFFLGGIEKARVLRALRPHIFFDDQTTHLEPAAPVSPAALVPY